MTESEWLVSNDPAAMLNYLLEITDSVYGYPAERGRKPSDRKLRLFVEACRMLFEPETAWGQDVDPVVAPRWWVAPNAPGEPAQKANLLREVVGNPFRPVNYDRCCGIRNQGTVIYLAHAAYDERLPDGTLDSARLAVLSDALEEAGLAAQGCIHCGGGAYVNMNPPCGCASQELLLHLRFNGPHVRGCWVLDLLCGKE